MTTAVIQEPREAAPLEATSTAPVVALKRRTIDSVLIGFGVVAMVAFAIAGAMLTWGHNFSSDYVGKELSSQNISFPSKDALIKGDRADLVKFADQKLNTGKEAEAYASFINGHLQDVAAGATYADLGAPESAAKAEVAAAVKAGQPQAQVDECFLLVTQSQEVLCIANPPTLFNHLLSLTFAHGRTP